MQKKREFKKYIPFLAMSLIMLALIASLISAEVIKGGDFKPHMKWAQDFSFQNPWPFLNRFRYPVWHILVNVFHLFGLSFPVAAIVVTTLAHMCTLWVTYCIVNYFLRGNYPQWVICTSVAIMNLVAGVYWPWYNKTVYVGALGSPNIWHSPTQSVVEPVAVFILFFSVHLYNQYQQKGTTLENGKRPLPIAWKNVLILALATLFSVFCKPSFVQGYFPAFALFLLFVLIQTKGKAFVFCCQCALAFVPSALVVLSQFFNYFVDDVALESGSGGILIQWNWGVQAPNRYITLLMCYAFPLFVLFFIQRTKLLKDKHYLLAVLFAVVSFVEAGLLHETARDGAGNFSWAKLISQYYLWMISMVRFLQWAKHADKARLKTRIVTICGGVLIAWHLVAGIYYWYVLTFTQALC